MTKVAGVRPSDPKNEPEKAVSSPPDVGSPLKHSGEVVVEHRAVPPAGPPDLKIHPRRPLPPVPQAPLAPDKGDQKDD
jgi:hypothetical protein